MHRTTERSILNHFDSNFESNFKFASSLDFWRNLKFDSNFKFLYPCRFLKHIEFSALFEIYKIHAFAQFWQNIVFSLRALGFSAKFKFHNILRFCGKWFFLICWFSDRYRCTVLGIISRNFLESLDLITILEICGNWWGFRLEIFPFCAQCFKRTF